MAVEHADDNDFGAKVIDAPGLVLVDFWAEWCGPCKQIAPALGELSEELSGKVRIVKVNIDENPKTPTNWGIRSIPTMILFQDGTPAATKVGAAPKSELKSWIEESL